MAATSIYPVEGPAIVRGDPLTIPVDITINGVPEDVSGWFWRAHIRRSADAKLIMEFSISVTTPPGGSVPNRVLLSLTPDQTRELRTGMTFDLEQLDNATTPDSLRTWWICTRMVVVKDVSHDG